MVCSVSSGKSSSKWLDRLRSSKGFPTGDDVDLEQFLNHPNPNNPECSESNVSMSVKNNIATSPKNLVHDRNVPHKNGDNELCDMERMSNVLSELFIMGESNNSPRIHNRKRGRKQSNPRICAVSTSMDVDERCSDDAMRDEMAVVPFSGDHNSQLEIKQKSNKMKNKEKVVVGSVDVEEEEEERAHGDLSRFSRMEVTVIDTSCPSWKFEKLLYRRKNVWKVRDKKCKWMNIGKKKRKGSTLDENVDGERQSKPSVGQCSKANEANWEEGAGPSNEVQLESERAAKEAHKRTPKYLNLVSEKGLFKNSKKHGSSSAVLVNSIPTGKNHVANVPKKCLKKKQKV